MPDITTSISHVYVHSSSIIKTIHYAINITSMKAKLFTIKYGINQATYLLNVKRIVVISDSIHTAKRIFDFSTYLYQIHSTAILCKLRQFFKRNSSSSIEFWNCPNWCNWSPHLIVNKETKKIQSYSYSFM